MRRDGQSTAHRQYDPSRMHAAAAEPSRPAGSPLLAGHTGRSAWLRAKMLDIYRPSVPGARRPRILLGVAMVVVATLVTIARSPHAVDSVYSEDGAVFLRQAVDDPPWAALSRTYAGYIHAAPRLISELVALLPLRWSAVAFALLSALVVSALALLVIQATSAYIASTRVRLLLAAGMVLLPVAQEEYLANIANLHWPLLFAAFAALLWLPESRWERALAALVVALAVLSDPLALLLLPVALARLWATSDRSQHLVTAAYVLSGGMQLAAVLTSLDNRLLVGELQVEKVGVSLNPPRTVAHLAKQVVGRGIVGGRLDDVGSAAAITLIALAGALLACLALFAWRRRDSLPVAIACLAVVYALLFYGVAEVSVRGSAPPRYSIVPVMLLYLTIAVILGNPATTEARSHDRIVMAVAVMAAVVWGANFKILTVRDELESWSTQVERAAAECRSRPAGASVTFPFFIRLTTTMPCDRVLA